MSVRFAKTMGKRSGSIPNRCGYPVSTDAAECAGGKRKASRGNRTDSGIFDFSNLKSKRFVEKRIDYADECGIKKTNAK